MRINLGSIENLLSPETTDDQLIKLLTEGSSLAVVKRVSAHSVILQIDHREVEWPLVELTEAQRNVLVSKAVVKLSFSDDYGLRLHVLSDELHEVDQPLHSVKTRELSQVLVELDIPATEETLLVAQSLLEQGFSLQKEILWALIPWAERGLLDEAIMLLQAGFPLKHDFIEIMEKRYGNKLGEPLVQDSVETLSPELMKFFSSPKWDNRKNWANHFREGDLFKVLARLLVEERLQDIVLQSKPDISQSFVFALPFALDGNLYSAWVKIFRENRNSEEVVEQGEEAFHLELEIPTLTMGVVVANLHIQSGKVNILFKVERNDEAFAEEHLSIFEQELSDSGWVLTNVNVEVKKRGN